MHSLPVLAARPSAPLARPAGQSRGVTQCVATSDPTGSQVRGRGRTPPRGWFARSGRDATGRADASDQTNDHQADELGPGAEPIQCRSPTPRILPLGYTPRRRERCRRSRERESSAATIISVIRHRLVEQRLERAPGLEPNGVEVAGEGDIPHPPKTDSDPISVPRTDVTFCQKREGCRPLSSRPEPRSDRRRRRPVARGRRVRSSTGAGSRCGRPGTRRRWRRARGRVPGSVR